MFRDHLENIGANRIIFTVSFDASQPTNSKKNLVSPATSDIALVNEAHWICTYGRPIRVLHIVSWRPQAPRRA